MKRFGIKPFLENLSSLVTRHLSLFIKCLSTKAYFYWLHTYIIKIDILKQAKGKTNDGSDK